MDTPSLLQALGALAFVLALMGLLWLGLRKFGLATPVLPPGVKRRLHIVDSVMLDYRHRAVLIRRDDVEHLVILSPNGETVVETGIKPHETSEK